jgi:hypothetical protein
MTRTVSIINGQRNVILAIDQGPEMVMLRIIVRVYCVAVVHECLR